MGGDNLLDSITTETAPSQDDRPGLSFTYTYDANKNLTAEDTGGNMDDYGFDLTHDAKDRMIGWDRDTTNTALDSQDWTLSYEADWDDSTLTDGGVGTTQTRTHDDAHQLLTLDPDGPGGVSALTQTHDPKGNLTGNGSGLTVGYDFDNMVDQVVVSSTSTQGQEGTHEYEYDALGRRVAKSVDTNADGTPDATTVFVCAGQQVIAEYTGGAASTAPDRKFLYGNYIDEPLVLIDATGISETLYYYHRNRQYSVVGLSDATGVVIERYAYTGCRIDPETGLQYFRARYYDPQLGRFLQRDPLGYPDGMNGYAAYHVMWGGLDPMGAEVWLDESRHHKTVDRVYKHRKDADYSEAGIRELTISWKASETQVNSNTVKVTLEAKSTAGVNIDVGMNRGGRSNSKEAEMDVSKLKPGGNHYMAYVGPPTQYDFMGATQFRLLCTLGLRANHSLLDFGCGSLRAGRLFLSYLDKGNYFGIEPNKWLIDDAISNEVGKDLIALKKPQFDHNADLKTDVFPQQFDFILAQSIFSHAGSELVLTALFNFNRSLKPHGLVAVTFVEGVSDYDGGGWTYPGCVKYRQKTIEHFANEAGFSILRIPWYHPRQTWYVLAKHKDRLPSNAMLRYLSGAVLFDPAFA